MLVVATAACCCCCCLHDPKHTKKMGKKSKLDCRGPPFSICLFVAGVRLNCVWLYHARSIDCSLPFSAPAIHTSRISYSAHHFPFSNETPNQSGGDDKNRVCTETRATIKTTKNHNSTFVAQNHRPPLNCRK